MKMKRLYVLLCTFLPLLSAAQSPVIHGDAVPCKNELQQYYVDSVAGAQYIWTVTNGQIVSGQGTAHLSVQWNAAGNGHLSVEVNACGKVRFDQLAVGQKSEFVFFNGYKYYMSESDSFEYRKDTLVWEVIGEDALGFVMQEKLTPGSASLNGENNVYTPDSVFTYHMKVQDDSLRINMPGYLTFLFTNYGPANLKMSDYPGPQVTIGGWNTSLPYCECYHVGYALDVHLLGAVYDRLNVMVDDTSMQVDGPGFTYIYAPKYGIVKYYISNWWTQGAGGWVLLP